ncbi:hypothetical protein [Rosenbergiella australiborealis]
MTLSQSRWVITGYCLTLAEIKQLTQQLEMLEQVSEFRINELTRSEEYYQFKISFLLIASTEEYTD